MRQIHILFTTAAAIALLTTSCARTDNSMNDSEPISFRPFVGSSATKAIVNDNVFPTDWTFDVACYTMPTDPLNESVFKEMKAYFPETEVCKEGSVWGFKNGERYYWPFNGSLSFFAHYPTTAEIQKLKLSTNSFVSTPDATYLEDYTIKHTDASGDAIEDNASKNDGNLSNASVDFMSSLQIISNIRDRSSNAVELNFGHALTQLRFEAVPQENFNIETADPINTGNKLCNTVGISIIGIELDNIYSVGTYRNQAPHWKDQNTLYSYYPLTGTSTPVEFPEVGGQITPTVIRKGDSPLEMLVIPQNLHSSAAIRVTYTLSQRTERKNASGEVISTLSDYTAIVTKSVNLSSVTTSWLVNSCVTYTFVISLDDIEVTAEYSGWKNGGEHRPVI